MIPQATTIDEVIVLLHNIILQSIQEKSTKGYFSVLYLKVTQKVKEGIAKGTFQNGPRMEKLDVIFANRYIKAYYQNQKKMPVSESWEIAFKLTDNYWLIVLQHLLLGMNAHINLDLGIAAAQVCPKEEIHKLQKDFNTINAILSSLVADVERDLCEIWPTLLWILKKTKNFDSFFIDFSMQRAREGAWNFALEMAPLSGSSFDECVLKRDICIAEKAKLVTNSGCFTVSLFKIMRLFEIGDVVEKIKKLED
ncbi:DUF5995 family protein [Flavobacterium cellulosilyticum]|uniref:Uncharacterized protein n=1 Tax=Flavobacterium cellulosilyticum TaxID=2541731 RepID=A0A4R5CPZ6_9FLAO|nr:DUF5995 family protein [Flavobacterium cellulosilyticum]TDD99724.1 hypothetical protein E0F76_03100 [Flavobacterium cellulosilyticum]